jgi:hypothetical protein
MWYHIFSKILQSILLFVHEKQVAVAFPLLSCFDYFPNQLKRAATGCRIFDVRCSMFELLILIFSGFHHREHGEHRGNERSMHL